MRARQLSLLPKPRREYGGDASKGRRKTRRPFDPKRALAHTGAIVDRALSVRPRLPEAPPLLDS